jgi:hypothetical protein
LKGDRFSFWNSAIFFFIFKLILGNSINIPLEKEIWQKAGRKLEDKDKQGVQKIQQIYTPAVEIWQDQIKLLTYFIGNLKFF